MNTKPETVEDAAARLGEALGLEGPIPQAAARRALDDPLFARALVATRLMPEIRDQLLAAPSTARITPPPDPAAPPKPAPAPPSSAQLAAKAAGSVLKWGMEGLTHAEPWVVERRLAACNACPNQDDAPDTLVYRGVKVVAGKDAKICKICHCLTNTKAAMATEHCPERDPGDPTRSRWGEPWVDPETLPGWPWR